MIVALGGLAGCGGDPPLEGVPLPDDAQVDMVRRECVENDGPTCFRGALIVPAEDAKATTSEALIERTYAAMSSDGWRTITSTPGEVVGATSEDTRMAFVGNRPPPVSGWSDDLTRRFRELRREGVPVATVLVTPPHVE